MVNRRMCFRRLGHFVAGVLGIFYFGVDTELGRRTGLSRAKLRRLKTNGFCEKAHGLNGQKKEHILDGYSSVLDTLLKSGVSNSTVCLERLQTMGFTGSRSTVKRYIAAHKHLIPAKRQLVAPQGNRGRRYTTEPGETYQMDWGFTNVRKRLTKQCT